MAGCTKGENAERDGGQGLSEGTKMQDFRPGGESSHPGCPTLNQTLNLTKDHRGFVADVNQFKADLVGLEERGIDASGGKHLDTTPRVNEQTSPNRS